jgi:uncharacterized protein (TIGR03118 family)
MSIVRVKCGITAVAGLAVLVGCGGGGGDSGGGGGGGTMQQSGFIDKALVADTSALKGSTNAATSDASLKNPWGIAFGPGLAVWVANQVTSTTTLYDGNGAVQTAYSGAPAAITIAKPGPTGTVYNFSISGNSGSFTLPDGAPAQFLYATLSGTIEGWDLATAATTHTAYDGSASGTAYTGLAIGQDGGGNWFLYAADFTNGKVDMLDHGFNLVTPAGAFATPTGVPAGFVPYGIQNIVAGNGAAQIIVTYAQQNAGKSGAVPGAGLGYVAQFDHAGTLLKLLISGGALNAPWGVAIAPTSFGPFGGALLVGNFGDGTINAFNASTGASMGALKSPSGTVLALAGLWGIAFGNGAASQPATTLFYTAGANNQADGIYGRIDYGTVSSGGGGGSGGY